MAKIPSDSCSRRAWLMFIVYYIAMRIGIFDSGLGGLIVAKAIRRVMPEYDYVYLGDTKRVPYGNRSHDAVFEFAKEGIDYLFRRENCAIVIVACNTASALSLQPLQKFFKGKKVLGVLIPAAEEAAKFSRVGVLGTTGTIASKSFPKEIKKRNKNTKVFQNSAPLLVPLAEEGENGSVRPFLKKYLAPFKNKKIEALVLGCTHYPIFKKEIKQLLRKVSPCAKIISQDEIVPAKLKNYLARHSEITRKISLGHRPTGEAKKGTAKILVTDETQTIDALARQWFGKVKPRLIHL